MNVFLLFDKNNSAIVDWCLGYSTTENDLLHEEL